MSIYKACFLILVLNITAWGQSPAAAPAECKKTITFAIAAGGQPVPAIPKFAAKWIGNGKHLQDYSGLCLSQTPSSESLNYIVVFSNSETVFNGLIPAVHTYTSTGPLSGNVAGVSGYGGTWTYSYTGKLPGKEHEYGRPPTG